MNIFSYSESSNECFALLIETLIDTTKKPTDPNYIISKPGIKITVFGQTEGTKVYNLEFI